MTASRSIQYRGAFRALVSGHALVTREALLLVVLSAFDLLTTYVLLWQGHFYEANPLADWAFQRWNIAGMTAFKFGLVAVILLLCETIERHRPKVGRAIVLLGCLGALAVTVRGIQLLFGDSA